MLKIFLTLIVAVCFIIILLSDSLREAVNKLPESLKAKALDMINSPRYGLF